MEKLDQEQGPDHTNSNPPSKMQSPTREPELEPISFTHNPPPETLPPRREPELQPVSLSPSPSPEMLSPRTESESDHAIQNPPPKTHSPPLELHDKSSALSSLSDFSTHEEEEKAKEGKEEEEKEEEENHNHKQPPVKPQATPVPDEVPAVATKAGPTAQQVDEEPARSHIGSGRRSFRPNLSILKRAKRDSTIKKSLLGFRVCGFVFTLVSFSVLAADKDRGWALDSFYRYKEFSYCIAVNVIAFVYSGFQSFDLAYQLTAGERRPRQNLRYYLDFSTDQILTYLLLSASSSAAVRVDDWQSNWGKDEFPDMAKASVALSFLAFVALGISSLISGYTLYTLKSM